MKQSQLSQLSAKDVREETYFILNQGYRIHHSVAEVFVKGSYYVDWEISFAWKLNRETLEGEFFYTVKSENDSFSRPVARRMLAKYIKQGVHRVAFKPVSGQFRDVLDGISISLEKEISANPVYFPSEFTKEVTGYSLSLF